MTRALSYRPCWLLPCLFAGLLLSPGTAPGAESPALAPAPLTPPATDPPGRVTLEALVAEAVAKNPELRFYEAEIEAAQAGRRTAGLLSNPELETSVGRKTANGSGPAGEGVAWSVSLVQPFEWPGRLGLRKAIANHDLELARLGLDRFRRALAGRTRILAFGLHAGREKSAAAREVADRFTALRDVLVQREPAGLTPLLETRIIEATELNARRKAADAELAIRSANRELNQWRGQPHRTELVLDPPALEFLSIGEPATWLAAARTNNFELRSRLVELEQQGLRVELARNERFPPIRVGPFLSEEAVGSDRERIAGLAISLPLPLWSRNRGGIDAAAARRVQAETLLRVAERDLERRILETADTYAVKVREMAAWRPDAVAHFRQAAEVADRHYRLGAVPVATYVELQKQYLEAVESLLDTRREALEAAVQLEQLTGLPLPLQPPAAHGGPQ